MTRDAVGGKKAADAVVAPAFVACGMTSPAHNITLVVKLGDHCKVATTPNGALLVILCFSVIKNVLVGTATGAAELLVMVHVIDSEDFDNTAAQQQPQQARVYLLKEIILIRDSSVADMSLLKALDVSIAYTSSPGSMSYNTNVAAVMASVRQEEVSRSAAVPPAAAAAAAAAARALRSSINSAAAAPPALPKTPAARPPPKSKKEEATTAT